MEDTDMFITLLTKREPFTAREALITTEEMEVYSTVLLLQFACGGQAGKNRRTNSE